MNDIAATLILAVLTWGTIAALAAVTIGWWAP